MRRIRSGLFLALSDMFSKIFGGIVQLAIVQLIPYQDYSIFVLFTRLQVLVQVGSDWGVSTAILRHNCNDENIPIKGVPVLASLVAIFSIPVLLALTAYFIFPTSFHDSVSNILNIWGVFFLLIVFLFGSSLYKILSNIAVCDELFSYISAASVTVSVLFGMLMILSGFLFGVIGIIIVSSLAPWGYVLFFLYKKIGSSGKFNKKQLSHFFKKEWKFSNLCALANIASQLQYSIGFFFLMNVREIAVAGLLYSLLNYMRLIPQAAVKVIFKKYFGAGSEKMYSVKNNMISVVVLSITTLIVFLLFYCIYCYFGHYLPVVYHDMDVVIFSAGLMFTIWITIVPWAQMNLAAGRVHVNLYIVMVELLVNIVFLYFIVDDVTAINMFYSLSISYGIGALLHIIDRIIYNKNVMKNNMC